jgi:hypothetical protein
MNLQDVGWREWSGLVWLRTGTGGRHLWMRRRIFGFHKMKGISSLDEDQLASQEGLYIMELFPLFHVLQTYRFLVFEHEGPVTERPSTALILQLTLQGPWPDTMLEPCLS